LANPEELLKRHFINTNKEAQKMGKMGLKINEAKTKFMEETMNMRNTQSVSKLVITQLRKCMNFKYSGTLFTSNNNLSTEIHHRLQIANSCYLGLQNQLWSQWTRINAKLKLYK
jgi:hypothetical protein